MNKVEPFPPDYKDLTRLVDVIIDRRCFTVLEFGVGYSTICIAKALEQNEREWRTLKGITYIRNNHMFQLFSVDASQEWIDHTKKEINQHQLRDRVHFHYSSVVPGTFRGQLCHYYTNLPDIVPDFIYLDGPNPNDVEGKIRGLSFQCEERTVMSADILLMEPTLLPGCFILVDGRTNNARFLERNLQRDWKVVEDKAGDVTTFELIEDRLGKFNVLGSDFY